MLVDDPVKRVDNMTMAWGLEGRVPFLDHELVELAATCPPELKTAHDGKGVLKEAARRVIPAEVIDRPKGYFPVPALTHLEGPYLDLVRDALYAPVAKERGLFRPEAVDATARRPQRPADPAARQRTLADRAAGAVAAEARHLGAGGVTTDTDATTIPRPSPSGCTTRRHQHLVDAMADDVVLELGWGRLIFGQTFADPEHLAEVLRGERPRPSRHLHLRPRVARAGRDGARTSCSSTRATPTGCGSPTDDEPRVADVGFHRAAAGQCRGRRRDEPRLRALRHGARARRRDLGQPAAQRRGRPIWSRCATTTAPSSAPSPASTTSGCSPTPRTARACGHWPSTRRRACPVSAPR